MSLLISLLLVSLVLLRGLAEAPKEDAGRLEEDIEEEQRCEQSCGGGGGGVGVGEEDGR
jgi:hypothetical protein